MSSRGLPDTAMRFREVARLDRPSLAEDVAAFITVDRDRLETSFGEMPAAFQVLRKLIVRSPRVIHVPSARFMRSFQ